MTVLKLPTVDELNEIDLSPLTKILEEAESVPDSIVEDFTKGPGKEPYALYAYLSTTFDNGTILDIGTLFGSSAVALSHNPTNQVISYDVNEHNDHGFFSERDNLTWKHMDFQKDETINWKEVKMILIDTDHTGEQETGFINFLIEKDWCGILLLDDIHQNPGMEDFWDCFDDDIKQDVTGIGHTACCGTGYVEFDI
jgi:hypothetical protein|tara:strand:- start:158 stop:748 length:591 start_codon:yes stop_codon:yes gene_type:complete